MAHSGCRKTPKELLTSVEPTVRRSHVFGSKGWTWVPDKTLKALDGKERSGFLLQLLSNGLHRSMLEESQTVETAHSYFVREIVFPMKLWHNFIQVSSSEL